MVDEVSRERIIASCLRMLEQDMTLEVRQDSCGVNIGGNCSDGFLPFVAGQLIERATRVDNPVACAVSPIAFIIGWGGSGRECKDSMDRLVSFCWELIIEAAEWQRAENKEKKNDA